MADGHLATEDLHLLLDGALDAPAARAARAHLSQCRGCQRRLRAQERIFAAIESWEEVPIPRDLAPRLRHAVAPPRGERWRLATGVQAVVAVLVLVAAWPLVSGLASTITTPVLPVADLGLSEAATLAMTSLVASTEAFGRQVASAADAWLRLAPRWIGVLPWAAAAAGLTAIVGNTILLRSATAGPRRAGPRRS